MSLSSVLIVDYCILLLSVVCMPLDNGNTMIKHLVVLMMENHSYDHFLGSYPLADGSNSTMCNPLKDDDDDDQICVTHAGAFQ